MIEQFLSNLFGGFSEADILKAKANLRAPSMNRKISPMAHNGKYAVSHPTVYVPPMQYTRKAYSPAVAKRAAFRVKRSVNRYIKNKSIISKPNISTGNS